MTDERRLDIMGYVFTAVTVAVPMLLLDLVVLGLLR